ncbi:recombinase family protein [Bacillus sp. BRMEA1]|nr:recombinase family protein [Neobacillus endophyticus]
MSKVRAAIYIRVSTEEQKNNFSLKAQESVIRDYADNKGMEIYDVYCDDGYSGKDFNRPDVQRMFKDLSEDRFTIILVWKVDRLSRKNTDVLIFIDKHLTPYNKKLVITSIDIDSSTTTGYMFISLLSTFASYERATIIDRVNSGMQKRAEEGLWNGGTVLGYDSVEKFLVVNEVEQKLVEDIFTMRANGLGFKAIVNILNKRGEKTKNKNPFSISSVKFVLKNPLYIGKIRWGEHRELNEKSQKGKSEPLYIDGIHTPIISLDLWEKVQKVNQLQEEAFSNNRNFKGDFFLSGILRCPKCGAGTVMCMTKKRDGEGYHLYYMCQSYHSKGRTACSTNLIKKDVVEQKVLSVISELIQNEEIINKIIQKLDSEKEDTFEPVYKEFEIYQAKLNSLLSKQIKLDSDYFDEKIETQLYNRLSNELQIQIDEFKKKVSKQSREIEKVSAQNNINKEVVVAALHNFNELFNKADSEEKKMLIRALIKEIHMENNRKDIKKITFWFSSESVLPSNEASRTA